LHVKLLCEDDKAPDAEAAVAAAASVPSDELYLHRYFTEKVERKGEKVEEDNVSHRRKKQHNPRPCKGKRQRLRKLMGRLMYMAETKLDDFDISSVKLPPCVAGNQNLQAKITRRVEAYAALKAHAAYGGPQDLIQS